ncbi:MAG: type II secretory pathway predicted ATPase ExeA [Oceanicoccus sp.]|jgi:type II secretory pathway predicted ATPase ExeA
MYQQYFGLAEDPFSIAPDPRYLFLSDKHREALAHLIYGVGNQGGFVVLTGEVGTGKTTICRCLLKQIPENANIAYIINPKQSINQLLQSICNDLGIYFEQGRTSKDLIDDLNKYLLEAHAKGRNTILIIDEAQNLSIEILEQLRLLTNLETNEKKLLQLVLLGQPELNELLSRREMRQLAQRVTARFHLTPLSKDEVTQYIEHRLSVAGCRNELFRVAAINSVYKHSRGIPRLINQICDRALLGVYATNENQVTRKIANKASKEIFLDSTGYSIKAWRPVLAAILLSTVVLTASYFWKSSENISEDLILGDRLTRTSNSIERPNGVIDPEPENRHTRIKTNWQPGSSNEKVLLGRLTLGDSGEPVKELQKLLAEYEPSRTTHLFTDKSSVTRIFDQDDAHTGKQQLLYSHQLFFPEPNFSAVVSNEMLVFVNSIQKKLGLDQTDYIDADFVRSLKVHMTTATSLVKNSNDGVKR